VTSLEVALRLLLMEAGLILLVGFLGSGLAALVPGKVPPAARVALAPAMGLAAGFALMLTASQFMSMSVGAFAVLVPLTVLSAAFAAVRARRCSPARRSSPSSHVLCLALAVSIPLAIFSAPLIEQRSLGPGAYLVSDAAQYADFNDHLEHNSWRDERFGLGKGQDRFVHDFLASPIFQTGTIPFAAALNATFGWRAIDAQSALMIALVGIGALGCFALVLTATGSAWAGLAAAALYAGPVNYQLFIDGSEAALAALAMLGPVAIVGSRLLRAPVRASALFGLLVGGMITVYPAFLPVVAVAFALAMAIHFIRRRRVASLRTVLISSAVVAMTVVVFAPVSLAKNASYASAVSRGELDEPADEAVWREPIVFAAFGKRIQPPPQKETFPDFLPPAETAVAWVTQSRERYDLPPLEEVSPLNAAILGILLPAGVVALAAIGALRWRSWAFLLLAVAVSLALAYYAYHTQDCSYCGQRALLAIPPVLAVLASCGLVATAAWVGARRGFRDGAIVAVTAGLLLVGAAFYNDHALARKLLAGGYLFGAEARGVVDATSGKVLIEGASAGNSYTSYFESNLLPLAIREAAGRRPLLDWKGLGIAQFPRQYPPGPPNPGYRFVFTRLGGIRTDRRVVVQHGPYALEERVAPLDVTVTSGVDADILQRNPAGSAWVTGPITLLVADLERAPAHVTLEVAGPGVASLRLAGRGDIVREAERAIVCVPSPGSAPVRRVRVPLHFEEEGTSLPAAHIYEPPIPATSLELESLSAARECPPELHGATGR
jgi:MFS family permease